MIDAVQATVMNVTSTVTDGTYGIGAVIPIEVTFSRVVNVVAPVTLTLETGTPDATVSYTSGSGTNVLTFNYTVASGNISSDLSYVSTASLAGAGTIKDVVGNDAIRTLPALGAGNSLNGSKQIVIDGVAPTVTSIIPSPTVSSAASVNFTITFSEPVTGVDAGNLSLTTTGTIAGASIDTITGTGNTRTVAVLTGTGTGTIRLNLASASPAITDAIGNALTATFNTGTVLTVDRTIPTGTITTPANGGSFGSNWVTPMAGTSADTGGGAVSNVQWSMQQGTGDYWSGSSFSSVTEVKTTATGTTSWTAAFAAANFTATGPYTLRVYVTDTVGNVSNVVTSTFTIIPTVTAVSPNAVTQGATGIDLVITGTRFEVGAVASFGAGITVNSTTFNSATSVTANVDITAGAATGARNVVVTNANGTVGTGTNLLTVNGIRTWTGTTSTAWALATNWSPAGIPAGTDDVIIPSATNSPVITTSITAPRSITVQNGGILTNGTGGIVNVGAGGISFLAGSTYNHNQNGGTIPDATWNATSTVIVSGVTTTLPGGVGQAFGNFTWNSTSQTASLSFAGGFSAGSGTSIAGALSVVSTGSGSIRLLNSGTSPTLVVGAYTQTNGTFAIFGTGSTNTATLTVLGNFALSNGTFRVSEANTSTPTAVLNVAGNFTVSGGTFQRTNTSGTATVNFNGSSAQTFTKSGGTISGAVNFAILSGATVNFGTSVLDGSSGTFTLNSGATMGIGHVNGISTSAGTGQIQVTGARSFNAGANYIYNGSSAQVAGNGLPATVNSLAVNNAAGLTLGATTTVTNGLTLTAGAISTGANALVANGTVTRAAGYVNGNLRKPVAVGSAVSRTFEVGTAAGYAPVTLLFDTVSGAGTVTVSSTTGDHPSIASSGLDPAHSVNRYWTITNGGVAFTTYNPTFDFVAGDVDSGSNTANFLVRRFAASVWNPETTGTLTSTSSEATGVTGFGEFAIGETDTTPPTVVSIVPVNASPTNATAPTFTVTFSESVSGVTTGNFSVTSTGGVTGASVTGISGSGVTRTVTVDSGSGDGTIRLDLSSTTPTITDLGGNALTVVFDTGTALTIDKTAPVVTGVSSSQADGTYGTGTVIPVAVSFDGPVVVTGTPQLAIATGTPASTAVNLTSGGGTATLTFNYTVIGGNNSADLDYVSTSSLGLNGGTIRDAAGNNAILTLAAPGDAGSLGASNAIVIDAVRPLVTDVTSSTLDGTYTTGAVISIQVTFDDVVTVVGTPRLTLETGGTDAVVNYTSGTGTNTLTFNYTVAAGHTSPDLSYVNTSSLAQFSGSTIRDGLNNDAILTLPAVGGTGSLSFNKDIVIDALAPATVSVTSPVGERHLRHRVGDPDHGDVQQARVRHGCADAGVGNRITREHRGRLHERIRNEHPHVQLHRGHR